MYKIKFQPAAAHPFHRNRRHQHECLAEILLEEHFAISGSDAKEFRTDQTFRAHGCPYFLRSEG